MLKVYKVDQEYIVLREDEGIPALGQEPFYRTPADALHGLARQIVDDLKSFEIEANEYAPKELIERYGFTAV